MRELIEFIVIVPVMIGLGIWAWSMNRNCRERESYLPLSALDTFMSVEYRINNTPKEVALDRHLLDPVMEYLTENQRLRHGSKWRIPTERVERIRSLQRMYWDMSTLQRAEGASWEEQHTLAKKILLMSMGSLI